MARVVDLDAPLVVGAGIAGLSTALGLDRAYLISSDMGSTWWAQGGIAAAVGPGDSTRSHARDTQVVNGGMPTAEAVEILTAGGPEAIERLVALGALFDRDPDGELLLGRESGHATRRVVRSDGDATGAELMRVLDQAVDSGDSVTRIESPVVDLVRARGRVAGVVSAQGKQRTVYTAPAVVIATGGAGQIFAQTTNPSGVLGEGIVMAARAGARLADLEFTQFHPTALMVGKDPMPLVPDSLRDEGASLVDAQGRRFMERYHPAKDRAPREVLARAIFQHYAEGSSVYMDLRKVININDRLPTLTAHALSVGLDPVENLLPVAPAAHFLIGGIDVDLRGRTSLDGLWAVGESAASGVHGANRLASNSLLEGLVFGARVAADVAGRIEAPVGRLWAPKEALELPVAAGPMLEEMRKLMWGRVGPVRNGVGLAEAHDALLEMESVMQRTITGRNAHGMASMMVIAALRRSESRGCHFRADHPRPDPMQRHRMLLQPGAVESVQL